MSYFDAIILGLIQGLTEFLPVSSSGHLVLTEHLLHVNLPGVVFELIVHIGTLLAVLVYFRKNILLLIKALFDKSLIDERKMILYLIVGTIPAVIVALLFDDYIESAFGSPLVTSVMLTVTGGILLVTAIVRKKDGGIKAPNAIIIGCAQALAIFPGISRSGSTIAAGMFAGVTPVKAAEFSFLLSIPAITGALVFKIKNIMMIDSSMIGQYAVGAAVSFLSGLMAVYFLLSVVRKGKLQYFGIYCIFAGLLGIRYFM